jgi:hydrogenase maturation protease
MKTATRTETTLLVIGFGNTLRSDDASGPLVAGRIGALGLAGVRALKCPLLAPEFAAELAGAIAVVFVDATAADMGGVALVRIAPQAASQAATHALNPRTLLAMARDLYGNAPAAWLLKVPAENFAHGEELSPLARRGIEEAINEIRALVAEWMF